MRKFSVADIVEFVPYYAPSGMQGASLQLQQPKHPGYALVLKINHNLIRVLIPNGAVKSFNRACLQSVCSLKDPGVEHESGQRESRKGPEGLTRRS